MKCDSNVGVIFREDVQAAFRCCPSTALLMMKRTGFAFKVGKRWAINAATFYTMLHGRQANTEEVG